jgi:hypothetical protein
VTERDSALRSDVAELLAALERAAADLAIGEEPAGFAAALDAAASPPVAESA